MDALPLTLVPEIDTWRQRTLKASIGCVGVGLHSGLRVNMTLRPAPARHGIVFRRTDLDVDIPARFDHVVDTRLATVLGLEDGTARVGTVEHLMAALAGSHIDNAVVEVDGPELPILDGSAAPYLFLLDCAGSVEQEAPRPMILVHRRVRVSDGDAFAELRPSAPGSTGLDMAISIDFSAAAIGRQALSLELTPESFRRELARARTFTLAQEIEQMRAAGLALGGSLDNAVVVDDARVLNPAGLRMPDEFARHKLLDAVGDLALAGAQICGRFVAHRSGHALNNRLLRALFSEVSARREISVEPLAAEAA
jgi:UDP-3-O-[3-hydroxymyristoyl] N-acetylglucosamine deacetylase